jgi:hypothetical protein
VRPFFADGREYSLRAFAVGAFNDEMGLQSPDPVLCAASDPAHPVRTVSPTGMVFDPALDKVKRPPTCDAADDADHDGVADELDPAIIDYTEMYLLNYFRPGIGKTTARTSEGLSLMRAIGCMSCHVQNFRIAHDRRIADVDTRYDPDRGVFNRLYAIATPIYDTIEDGSAYPKRIAHRAAFTVENLFTDFRRHDLGAAFHERNYDGTVHTAFMTSPLWGVGSKAPYGHDGRSISLEDVILRHGGEAEASKQTFVALGEDNQRKVLEFLGTLVLFPPDDTASNLDPGHPGAENPQDPAAHGSIALSALFEIASEGSEWPTHRFIDCAPKRAFATASRRRDDRFAFFRCRNRACSGVPRVLESTGKHHGTWHALQFASPARRCAFDRARERSRRHRRRRTHRLRSFARRVC